MDDRTTPGRRYPQHHHFDHHQLRLLVYLLGYFLAGHLGGFLTGLAASTPVVLADKKLAAGATPAVRKRTSRLTWLGLALVAVVLVALTFIGALLIDTQALLGS